MNVTTSFIIVRSALNLEPLITTCQRRRATVITHADGSRVSIAIIRVCDSVCVRSCVHVCLSAR